MCSAPGASVDPVVRASESGIPLWLKAYWICGSIGNNHIAPSCCNWDSRFYATAPTWRRMWVTLSGLQKSNTVNKYSPTLDCTNARFIYNLFYIDSYIWYMDVTMYIAALSREQYVCAYFTLKYSTRMLEAQFLCIINTLIIWHNCVLKNMIIVIKWQPFKVMESFNKIHYCWGE